MLPIVDSLASRVYLGSVARERVRWVLAQAGATLAFRRRRPAPSWGEEEDERGEEEAEVAEDEKGDDAELGEVLATGSSKLDNCACLATECYFKGTAPPVMVTGTSRLFPLTFAPFWLMDSV